MIDLYKPTPKECRPDVRPAPPHQPKEIVMSEQTVRTKPDPSAVGVTILGCGGAGLNITRQVNKESPAYKVLYFDTSMTNSRRGEQVHLISDGSGSGSNRAENARLIENSIPQLTTEDVGLSDVAVVVFGSAGGTGGILGPLMIRDLFQRKARVITMVVTDTTSAVGAKNTLNTLKTLAAIARNNKIYLPIFLLSNDAAESRREVDIAAKALLTDLIDILTEPAYEVDRNDRLNWINPTKTVTAEPGLKLMTLTSSRAPTDARIVLGLGSSDMLDSQLILQLSPDDDIPKSPRARLKKMGVYQEDSTSVSIMGAVTSDISSIDHVIDFVEQMEHTERSQSHQKIERLDSESTGDIIV